PWGGFTKTLLPYYAISQTNAGWTWASPATADWSTNAVNDVTTNGWLAMVDSQTLDAFGLGIVFGQGPANALPNAIVRFGAQQGEDLSVVEGLPFYSTIKPGETFLFRYYLIINRLSPGIHPFGNTAAPLVQWTTLTFTWAETNLIDPCAKTP